MVTQMAYFFPRNGRGNIAFAPWQRGERLDTEQIDELLERVGWSRLRRLRLEPHCCPREVKTATSRLEHRGLCSRALEHEALGKQPVRAISAR
jgi:hypothetical protein